MSDIKPFATVADLEERWRPLTDTERPVAEVTLGDVTAYLMAQLGRAGVSVDPADPVQARNLTSVTCAVARRCLSQPFSGDESGGQYSSSTVTAGVFSQTYQYANPTGDMYLTAGERRLLGIGRMRVGSVAPYSWRLDAQG